MIDENIIKQAVKNYEKEKAEEYYKKRIHFKSFLIGYIISFVIFFSLIIYILYFK